MKNVTIINIIDIKLQIMSKNKPKDKKTTNDQGTKY